MGWLDLRYGDNEVVAKIDLIVHININILSFNYAKGTAPQMHGYLHPTLCKAKKEKEKKKRLVIFCTRLNIRDYSM